VTVYSRHFCTLLQPFPTLTLEQPFADAPATIVIRDMQHYMPAGVDCAFSVNGDDGAVLWSVNYGASDGQWEHWSGRQVFDGDFTLYYDVTGLTLWTGQGPSLRVCGYLLTP